MNFTNQIGLDESDLTTIGKLTSWALFLALESPCLGLYQRKTKLSKITLNVVVGQF